MNFNKLTPAEAELLAKLAEECGEVVQIVGKILCHGYESYNPFDEDKTTNRELLEAEAAHVEVVIAMLAVSGAINDKNLAAQRDAKLERIGKYLHYWSMEK